MATLIRHYRKGERYMTHVTARTQEELDATHENMLRNNYQECPGPPPTDDPRWRWSESAGDWHIPAEVAAKEDRDAAEKELRALERQFVHAAITYLAARPDAPQAIKNMKAQLDAIKARLS